MPEIQVVLADSSGTWPIEQIDITGPSGPRRLNIVMLGAGLSMTARPGSPSWRNLVKAVADKLGETLSEAFDPSTMSMHLSWRHAVRPATAEPSEFQSAIREVLKSYTDFGPCELLQNAFAAFLKAVHCHVIIDLNYDDVAERLLAGAGVPFYRIIGSQRDVEPPLPDSTILLWKIHGTLHFPSTIVLSPTEYQRLYETNELGTMLIGLGQKLHSVWTVGVGLSVDDVWSYLAAKAAGLEINALWLSSAATSAEQVRKEIDQWTKIVHHSNKRITIFAAPLPGSNQTENSLEHYLNSLCEVVEAGQPVIHWNPNSRLSSYTRERYNEFDERFKASVKSGSITACQAVIEEFRRDYRNLCNILLASTDTGTCASRWLPALRSGNEELTQMRAELLKDLCLVLSKTLELSEDIDNQNEKGLMYAVVVQYIVTYVLELLDRLNLAHEYSVTWPRQESLYVNRGTVILVGANPFDEDTKIGGVNPLHFFRSERYLKLRYPLWPNIDNNHDAQHQHSDTLLSEDEWEACIRHIFNKSKPTLKIGSKRFSLARVPPVYPWGFRISELPKYRSQTKGFVTRSWHLVSTSFDSGTQICKGGSLRDRSPRAFTIGGRGTIRTGEYDEFVISAYG